MAPNNLLFSIDIGIFMGLEREKSISARENYYLNANCKSLKWYLIPFSSSLYPVIEIAIEINMKSSLSGSKLNF